MLRYSFGGAVIFLSLKHFIAPVLDLTFNALLALMTKEGGNNGIKL